MPITGGSQIMKAGMYPMVSVVDLVTDEIVALGEVRDTEFTEAVTKISDQSTVNRRRTVQSLVAYIESTFKITIYCPSPRMKRMLLGGAAGTAVAGHAILKWVGADIPSAPGPYTVTLADATADDLLWIQYYQGNNQYTNMYEVAPGAEVAKTSYSRSGTTLTFHANDADAHIRYTNIYAASGTDALKIVWKLGDLPNIVKICISYYGQEQISGAKTLTVIDLPRCQIVSGRGFKVASLGKEDNKEFEIEPLPRLDGTSADEEYYTETTTEVTTQP